MSELFVCEWEAHRGRVVHARIMAAARDKGRAQLAGLRQVPRAISPEQPRQSQVAGARSPGRSSGHASSAVARQRRCRIRVKPRPGKPAPKDGTGVSSRCRPSSRRRRERGARITTVSGSSWPSGQRRRLADASRASFPWRGRRSASRTRTTMKASG